MRQKPQIILVAGARPNFMKVAPLWRALQKYSSIRTHLVHTGQHYDKKMSNDHFRVLGLPKPDTHLNVGSGSHGEQTAWVMERFETVLLQQKPSLVVVVGDVNSTMAAAITSQKLHIPVAHVEAGLRSHDWDMPEEINRVIADHVSDLLFTYGTEANENLQKEGISSKKVYFLGNVMIDSVDFILPEARKCKPLSCEPYGLITLHRPSNVDNPKTLKQIFLALLEISKKLPLFFPIHPRTEKNMKGVIQIPKNAQIHFLPPISYLEMIAAQSRARIVLTDSGGIQEETTVLGVPCLTLRESSERMITVTQGTNKIVGTNPKKILRAASHVLSQKKPKAQRPKFWDGKAAERISRVLVKKAIEHA